MSLNGPMSRDRGPWDKIMKMSYTQLTYVGDADIFQEMKHTIWLL